jgi:hypothetical protein
MANFDLTLIAVYNSPTTFDASTSLQDSTPPTGTPVILCGDFNLHAPDWDSSVVNSDRRTEAFQDWMMQNSFVVLNNPDNPTYHGHNFQFAKVDDLVIANADFFQAYDIGPIQVLSDEHYLSDHYPVSFDIYTHTDAEPIPGRYTFSESRREQWSTTLSQLMDEHRANLPCQASPQFLDGLAETIVTSITTATEQTMQKATGSSVHAKLWWNEDLSQLLTHLCTLAQGIRETNGNPYLSRQYKNSKAAFRAKVRHAKQKWATQRLEGATSQTVWEFIKWYKHSGKRSRPLYSTPSHVPAASDEERPNIFIQQFFPEPPLAQPFHPADEPEPPRPPQPLTREEVDYAIRNCHTNTAPGPSHINYMAVKWAWETIPETLFFLYSQCIQIGHYPRIFKQSLTTIVPKPNKNDYSVATSFQPIQLIECLGKILDKILAHRIQYEVARHEIVPPNQFRRPSSLLYP